VLSATSYLSGQTGCTPRQFLELVAGHDASPGYLFPVIDEKDRLSSYFADGLLFSDKVDAELNRLITRAQLNLLRTLQLILFERSETRDDFLPQAFRFSPSGIEDLTNKPSTTAVLLTELSKYNQRKARNVERFFGATGGMFNIATPNTYQQYVLSLFRLDIAVQNVNLADIKETLTHIDKSTMETLYLFRRQEIEKKIETLEDRLNAAIAAAEAEARQHDGVGQFATIALDLKEVLTYAAALAVSIEAGNAATGIESATKLGAAYQKLLQDSSYLPEGPGKVAAARKALDEARQALSALFVELAIERSRVSRVLQAARENQTSSRLTAGSRRGYRVILFQEMLKSVMISYFSDPTRDLATLKLNLIGLQTWLNEEFPLREPYFRLRDIMDRTCSDNNADTRSISKCILVKPSEKQQTIIARITNGKRVLEIPLYVIAPTPRSFNLPTYGLDLLIRQNVRKPASGAESEEPEEIFEPDLQESGTFE
jgi:hypothetical protein